MRYDKIDNKLFAKNRKKLQAKIPEFAISIMFSACPKRRNGDVYFKYRQDSDFFYFSGINQEDSILIISKSECYLFITKPSVKIETWEGKKLTKQEASEISGIKNIYFTNDFHKILRALFSKNIRTFYIQKQLQNKNIKNVRNFIKKYTSNYKLEDVGAISDKLRLIKEPEEIQLIKKAIGITYKAYIEVLTNIHPGQKEYEIEALITKVFIENGANAHAYDPIIASGANACFLHYTKNNKLMQENELVLMDFGAEYANYAADLSRTIPVNGKFSKEHKEIYLAVLDVQNELKKEYIPGNTIKNINEKAVKLMQQKMIDLNLFSKKDIEKQDSAAPLYKKYFMHGTAHFMGLDVHDSGTKLTVLEPGMILTCEPGIYINEQNVGIRIENDILITENTPIDLMKDFPVTPNEIESFI